MEPLAPLSDGLFAVAKMLLNLQLPACRAIEIAQVLPGALDDLAPALR